MRRLYARETGQLEYDYRAETPRSSGGVEESMGELSLDDDQPQTYSTTQAGYDPQYTTSSGQPGYSPGGQYSGAAQYSSTDQQYTASQYSSEGTQDPRSPNYTYSTLAQGSSSGPSKPKHHKPSRQKESQGGGDRDNRTRRDPAEPSRSHRSKHKDKPPPGQPTDPFYSTPNYYSTEKAPAGGSAYYPPPQGQDTASGGNYYSAPTQEPYRQSGAQGLEARGSGNVASTRNIDPRSPSHSSSVPAAGNPKAPESVWGHVAGSYAPGEEEAAEEDQFADDTQYAIGESRRMWPDPYANQGSSSTARPSEYADDPAYAAEAGSDPATGYAVNPDVYGNSDPILPPLWPGEADRMKGTPSADYEDVPTPRGGSPSNVVENIAGTGGNEEKLDYRFQVHHSTAFDLGRVFKVLWADPKGGNSRDDTTDLVQFKDSYGESFYVGIRRFVIIANDEGNCTCVPILTYRNLGCRKNGVKARMHGIIYGNNEKSSKRAKPLDGEPKLGFPPVCMKVTAPGEKLARESRVNYAKLATIEHNIKVFFIGRLEGEDFDIAKDAVDQCWATKTREPKKKHRH
ncbi:hypothetical protein MKZ38_000714 [Zalerion maritima]|uniref:DUF6590 domain-containing protein n=1 Tax=Zalerion maritima TaxID=339359 RepID=A0AAD5RSI5_9PEZI|nr:hypothetical protein MKZ38_000714 [Zalerion maritima]